jgi:hypothetical protein
MCDFALSQTGDVFILHFPIYSITGISELVVSVFDEFFQQLRLNSIA